MDIATRMKSYEEDQRLSKGTVIIRVDGKAFHTWTKAIKAKKPFDSVVHKCMTYATQSVAKHMQSFKLAYTQSDESTFLLANMEEREEGWFDYKIQKLASVTASLFTEAFNREYQYYCLVGGYAKIPAAFDARAFAIPFYDAANNFVWRQQDWNRNSVQMLGHYHMGHSRMQGLDVGQVRFLLEEEFGIDWRRLEDWQKFGTFVMPDEQNQTLTSSVPLSYDEINRVTGLDKYMENK